MAEKKKVRMTLPKKEDDIQRVVEEVQERHHEHHHEHGHEHEHEHEHHHHHHLDIDEFIAAVEVVLDSLNTRLKQVEDQLARLTRDVKDLYILNAKLYEAYLSEDPEKRRRALEDAAELLKVKTGEG